MASSLLSLLLLLFISPSFSYATSPTPSDLRLSPTADLPKLDAEKLIRSLNLFPNDSVNIRLLGNPAGFVPGKILEKRFSFFGAYGPSVEDLGHHAGYYPLPHSFAARMFYFFFESRNSKDDPVLIWLTGGPGCGSELALFYENMVLFDLATTCLLYGMTMAGTRQATNILFVDQPIGTGFSYTSNGADLRHDDGGVSTDLYDFLQAFFKEHPRYIQNDFYIAGESYAGHYVPALASWIHQQNKLKQGIYINLKGFAIGNGLTNPAIQYPADTDFALENGLINAAEYRININLMILPCELAINSCGITGGYGCALSLGVCNSILTKIMFVTGNINLYYDIRKKCKGAMCFDFSKVETFLNEQIVRNALGVGNLQFVSCSRTVHAAMMQDYMRNLEVGIPALLEDGIRMLVCAGEFDLICNWLGVGSSHGEVRSKGFAGSPTVQFLVDGAQAGLLKSYGPLSFLKVNGAGHMVPMDQPKAALQMLQRWMEGNLTVTRKGENVSLN